MERYCFDTSALAHFYDERDAGDGHIPHKKERLKYFFDECDRQRHEVLIPTPVLAELLMGVEEAAHEQILARLNGQKSIQVVPFDQIAAIECAIIFPEQKRLFGNEENKRKLKFDSQILAVCSSRDVSVLLTNDEGQAKKAAERGIKTMGIEELPIPDDARQTNMFSED